MEFLPGRLTVQSCTFPVQRQRKVQRPPEIHVQRDLCTGILLAKQTSIWNVEYDKR